MSYACTPMSQVQESKKLRIAFVHPDLGIGELRSAETKDTSSCAQEEPSVSLWMRQWH
jgi:hypothetical protein